MLYSEAHNRGLMVGRFAARSDHGDESVKVPANVRQLGPGGWRRTAIGQTSYLQTVRGVSKFERIRGVVEGGHVQGDHVGGVISRSCTGADIVLTAGKLSSDSVKPPVPVISSAGGGRGGDRRRKRTADEVEATDGKAKLFGATSVKVSSAFDYRVPREEINGLHTIARSKYIQGDEKSEPLSAYSSVDEVGDNVDEKCDLKHTRPLKRTNRVDDSDDSSPGDGLKSESSAGSLGPITTNIDADSQGVTGEGTGDDAVTEGRAEVEEEDDKGEVDDDDKAEEDDEDDDEGEEEDDGDNDKEEEEDDDEGEKEEKEEDEDEEDDDKEEEDDDDEEQDEVHEYEDLGIPGNPILVGTLSPQDYQAIIEMCPPLELEWN